MAQNIQSKSKPGKGMTYNDEEFLDAIQEWGGSAATSDIASSIGCTRRLAYNRLSELATSGRIKKETVGNSLLWHQRETSRSVDGISGFFANYLNNCTISRTNPRKGMVITIRRPHSQAILDGKKDIEFRRTRIEADNIPCVGFVYEPDPTKAIVSIFDIESIEQHPVEYLYRIGAANTPSTEESLKEYFSGKDIGTAIFIGDVHPLDSPIPLKKNEQGEWIFNPPQDFYYIDPVEFTQKVNKHYENSDKPGGRSHELGEFLNTS